jgi:hypothetical protein
MRMLAAACATVVAAGAPGAGARDLVSIPVVDHFPLHVDRETLKRNGAMLSFKYVMATPKGLGKDSAEGWESTEVEATIDCKEETYSLGGIAIYPEPLAQGAVRTTLAAPAEQRRYDIRPRSTAGYLADFLCKAP